MSAGSGLVKRTTTVDAHNDLLIELVHRAGEEAPFERHYLGELQAGGIGLQVCPMTALPGHLPERALRSILEQVAAFSRAVRENPRTVPVTTREQLAQVEAGERVGLLLAMEGVEALGNDARLFDLFWELGVRMVGLTWKRRNAFADGDAEPAGGGLSELGNELVDLLVQRGAIIDLAHANEGTFRDVLARSQDAPVVISHGCCRSICDMARNTSDEQLEALAERDGVIGILAAPPLLSRSADTSLARMVEHVDHVVRVVGVEHVGIGSDFMRQLYRSGALGTVDMGTHPDTPPVAMMDVALDGLAGPAGFGTLAGALAEHGYDEGAVAAIMGGNFMRVLRRALPARAGDAVGSGAS